MLTLAMIVKNEVQTIERTVDSVRDYVDEIVIGVDKQSDDGTREIAERIADKVVDINLSEELGKKGPVGDGDWGFSKARNDVLAECKKDNWRVILDGHEIVHGAERMEQEVSVAVENGYDGIHTNILFEPDDNGMPKIIYLQVRLISPDVLYRNPIHNVPIVRNVYESDEISVEHRKKDQGIESKLDRDSQRSDSTIKGLLAEIEKDRSNARSWFYLGNSYKENGRWAEAIDAYEEYLKIGIWKEERCHSLMNMGVCFTKTGKMFEAKDVFSRAIEEFPGLAEPYYYLADIAYKGKRYHEAQVWLEKCVELDVPVSKLFVTVKVYKVDRYDLLSMVYSHLGWYAKAIEQAGKALENVDNSRIKNNISIWEKWVREHAGSNEYYDRLWIGKEPSVSEKIRLSVMAKELGGAENILDFGSGPGWIMDKLKAGVSYTGVDISLVARDKIVEKGGRSVESLMDVCGEKFDGCILGEVLEHVVNDTGLLVEIKNLMKDGAVIVTSIPRYHSMSDCAHVRDYTAGEIMKLLSVFGESNHVKNIGPWAIYRSTCDG